MQPAVQRLVLILAICGLAVLAVGCGGGGGAKRTATSTAVAMRAATRTSTRVDTSAATPKPATPTPVPPAPSLTTAPTGPAQVIRHGDSGRKAVALTFDAGSDAGYTSQILDTLSANHIVAAFGVTGQFAERYSPLVSRIAAEGLGLINHTYDHRSFTGYSTGAAPLSQAERWAELDRTEAIIQQLAGVTTLPEFRPPYGDYDASVNADVGARGYRYNIMWTVDSQGWNGLAADAIVRRCLSMAEPGAIYIFHVGSQSQDGPALQGVIDGLRAAGYSFVPISDFAPR